jgi:hypothetical protein
MNITIQKDICTWITEFVEVNHKFYNYKFPPCPYAKSARLKNLVDVQAYEQNPITFTLDQIDNLLQHKKFNVRVLVYPYYMRWNYLLRWKIDKLNQTLIKDDYYAQYGAAISTKSQYPGLFKNKPYFIIIINKLSDVLAAQESLDKTDYYQNWTPQHYHNVVVKRKNIFRKVKQNVMD